MQDNPETAGSSDVTGTARRHKKTSFDEVLLMGAKLADFALDLSHCFLRLHDPKLERPDLTARQCRGARTRDANRIHAPDRGTIDMMLTVLIALAVKSTISIHFVCSSIHKKL